MSLARACGPKGQRLNAALLAAFVAGAGVLVGAAPEAAADHEVPGTSAALPIGKSEGAVVAHAGAIYYIGGNTGGLQTEIVRYDPGINQMTSQWANLPVALRHPAAASLGSFIYVLGGISASGKVDTIYKFDPTGRTVTDTGHRLPSPRCCLPAASDGSNIYAFGGFDNNFNRLNEVVKYNPSSGATTTGATLQPARNLAGAAWDGSRIIIVGGMTNSGLTNQVLSYNPGTNALTSVSPATHISEPGVASDGRSVYVFGGKTNNGLLKFIFCASGCNAPNSLPRALSSPRTASGVAWSGNYFHVLGGWDTNGQPLVDNIRWRPTHPYAGESSTCALLNFQPLPLVSCSVTHSGVITISCGESTCGVAADGTASATSSLTGSITVKSVLRIGDASNEICFGNGGMGTTASCGGHAKIDVSYSPGACTDGKVESEVQYLTVFVARATTPFHVCAPWEV